MQVKNYYQIKWDKTGDEIIFYVLTSILTLFLGFEGSLRGFFISIQDPNYLGHQKNCVRILEIGF